MSNLRHESWEEKDSLCFYCKLPCGFEAGDLAHIRNKRMWGDTKENTAPAHKECHRKFHAYGPSGVKPVPAKER
jgi:5-methylcytosine-specific restriction endonuclease McrA